MSRNRIRTIDIYGLLQFPEDTDNYAHAAELTGTITLEDGSTVIVDLTSANTQLVDTDTPRTPNTEAAWTVYDSIARVLQAQIGMGMVKTNPYDQAGSPAIYSFFLNGYGVTNMDGKMPLAGQDIVGAYNTLFFTLRSTNPGLYNLLAPHNPF